MSHPLHPITAGEQAAAGKRPRTKPTGGRRTDREVWLARGVDAVAMALLAVLAVLTFVPTFGAVVWRTGIGGAVLGVLVGSVANRWRWSVWATALAGVLAYFVAGGALALPSSTVAGLLPTGRTLLGLARGLVQAPKSTLTIDPPIGESGFLLVLPLLTLLTAGIVATRLLGGWGQRSDSARAGAGRATSAWIPWAVAGAVGLLFGLHEPVWPGVLGLGFVVVSLLWTTLQRRRRRTGVLRSTATTPAARAFTVGSGAVVLLVVGLVGNLLLPALEPHGARLVLRDAVRPPLDVHAWASPLQEFRANALDRAEQTLFTVDGLPADARVRVATLDTWDGVTYNVSNDDQLPDAGTFRRIGDRVSDQTPGAPAQVGVRVQGYRGVWVPSVGQTTAIRFDGATGPALKENFFYNRATGTAVTTGGLQAGDAYQLQARLPVRPPADEVTGATAEAASLPEGAAVPDVVKDKAVEWTSGASSDGDAASRLANRLRQGYYSHGDDYTSLPGHSAYRIQRLLDEAPMVGDEEQYSVAMALMARSQGLPARVVYGYAPAGSGTVAVRGSDVSAWVEVKLAGLGWVSFDPTPRKDRKPPDKNNPNAAELRPQVENPPPPPERPEKVPPDVTNPVPPRDQERLDRPFDLVANLPWILGAGIPLLLVALPIAIIVGAKLRRRFVRRRASRTVDRVSGGWAELLDRARDLGQPVDRTLTRQEAAGVLAQHFARADRGPGTQAMARQADAAVFGTRTPTPREAEQYWEEVFETLRGMRRSRSWWRRLVALVSVASLRRGGPRAR